MEGFQVTEIGEKIYCILDAGNSSFYVVEGEEKAAVIDTGITAGAKILPVIRELTDKPLPVSYTHLKELVYHVIEGADEHRDDARNRKTPQKSADRFRAERIFGRFHRGYLLSNEVKVHRLYRVKIPGKTPRLYSIP